MKGRKRIPDNMKVITGTDRPDRMNPDAPAPAEDMPRPPAWLNRRAVEHFGALRSRLEYLSIATSTDTEMLALAAARLAEIEECDELIELHGRVIETTGTNGATMMRANPAVGQRNEAMRHLHALLAEFGLSAASRTKVKSPKKKDESPTFTVIRK